MSKPMDPDRYQMKDLKRRVVKLERRTDALLRLYHTLRTAQAESPMGEPKASDDASS